MNKWIKWVVGLSSVAMFTSFIGLLQKYEQVTVATNTSTSDETITNGHEEAIFPEVDERPSTGSMETPSVDEGQNQFGVDRHHSVDGNIDQGQIRSRAS
ncbi:MAG: hypothetical protein K6T72_13320 [Anoxybacillus sp.]|nr:hypothetical protein [Anoxybacillus sp.]MCL6587466.1 hypothetical protein [Anoxybacillus sp.]